MTDTYYANGNEVQLFEQAYHQRLPVMLTGPTTLAALLTSLQMGFRTLAIEKRSSEVWNLLASVKTEFGKFGDAIAKVKDKLDQASTDMDKVAVRSRVITRRLRDVEESPINPQPIFPELLERDEEEESS